jgi:hypothetical protein
LVVERLEQRPPILEQSLSQAQFDSLQVGDPVAGEVLPDHVQEGGGFLELGGGDFLGLKFFLLSGLWSWRRVSWSLTVT